MDAKVRNPPSSATHSQDLRPGGVSEDTTVNFKGFMAHAASRGRAERPELAVLAAVDINNSEWIRALDDAKIAGTRLRSASGVRGPAKGIAIRAD